MTKIIEFLVINNHVNAKFWLICNSEIEHVDEVPGKNFVAYVLRCVSSKSNSE